jgi:hypothetical protein
MHDSGRGVTSNRLHLFRIAFDAPASSLAHELTPSSGGWAHEQDRFAMS